MARFEDARAGWEIFKGSEYAATLDEINDQLTRRDFSPVAPRTYSHYLKLKKKGYLQYIPINQLDIKTLKDPFWDSAVRNRYTPLPTEYLPVEISFRMRDRDIVLHGVSIETSASSATCRVSNPEAMALLQRKATQQHLRRERTHLKFSHTGTVFPAFLEGITIGLNEQFLVLKFGFVSLAAVDLMVDREPLSVDDMILRVTPTTENTAFSEIARKLYWLFQASEAVRLACEDMLTQMDEDRRYVVPSTKIESLQMRSPLQLAIVFAVPVVALLYMIVDEGMLPSTRRNKKAVEVIGSNRLQGWLDATHQAVKDATGIQSDQGFSDRTKEIFEEQLAPAILELFDDASGTIEVLPRQNGTAEDGDER